MRRPGRELTQQRQASGHLQENLQFLSPVSLLLMFVFYAAKKREQRVFKQSEVGLGALQESSGPSLTSASKFLWPPRPARAHGCRLAPPTRRDAALGSRVGRDGKGLGSEWRAHGAAVRGPRDSAVPSSPGSSSPLENVGRGGERPAASARSAAAREVEAGGPPPLAPRPTPSPFRASSWLRLGSRFPRLK